MEAEAARAMDTPLGACAPLTPPHLELQLWIGPSLPNCFRHLHQALGSLPDCNGVHLAGDARPEQQGAHTGILRAGFKSGPETHSLCDPSDVHGHFEPWDCFCFFSSRSGT